MCRRRVQARQDRPSYRAFPSAAYSIDEKITDRRGGQPGSTQTEMNDFYGVTAAESVQGKARGRFWEALWAVRGGSPAKIRRAVPSHGNSSKERRVGKSSQQKRPSEAGRAAKVSGRWIPLHFHPIFEPPKRRKMRSRSASRKTRKGFRRLMKRGWQVR